MNKCHIMSRFEKRDTIRSLLSIYISSTSSISISIAAFCFTFEVTSNIHPVQYHLIEVSHTIMTTLIMQTTTIFRPLYLQVNLGIVSRSSQFIRERRHICLKNVSANWNYIFIQRVFSLQLSMFTTIIDIIPNTKRV